MKQEIKYGIMGILTLPVALFFIVSGLMDILSVTGGSSRASNYCTRNCDCYLFCINWNFSYSISYP